VINDEKSEESNDYKKSDNNNNISSIPQDGSKLLIILVDGFRFDYVQKDKSLKGFPRIAREGVSAQHVTPIFPANSYPNWYAITTGLYSESHGIVQNIMYDKKHDELFLMAPNPNASHPFWWNETEPLWITSEKSGVKSALYLWDGCQVEIRGYKPSICVPYKSLYEYPAVSNETRKMLNKVLNDFKEDKYRLGMVYYEYVDHTGHYNGPLTKKNIQAIRDIDEILFELQDSIKRLNLQDDVNVVVVSDHGMLDCQHFDQIEMEKILDFNDIKLFLGGGALAMILPEEGKEDSVS
jgi:ectonucleotide pyrophosphatase/phosphodiesterase family protein 6